MIKGFKMKLHRGKEEEYRKRHDQIWPEMIDLIREYGGHNYSIFYDYETGILFGYIEIDDEKKWTESTNTVVNRKWWDYMADIMETYPDNNPVSKDLELVFHLD